MLGCNNLAISRKVATWYFIYLHVQLQLECKMSVRPPSNDVAAISDEANASAIPFCDRIVDKINVIENVFPVPPGTSKKKNPPVSAFATFIIVS
jgi:hypothetical protein